MDRARPAVLIPLVVLIFVGAIAVAIGMFLHFVEGSTHGMGALAEYTTPLAALVLVVIVTAAGFIADSMAPREPA
jgi:hypothetical protein